MSREMVCFDGDAAVCCYVTTAVQPRPTRPSTPTGELYSVNSSYGYTRELYSVDSSYGYSRELYSVDSSYGCSPVSYIA